MKKIKSIFAIVTVICMTLCLFAACGDGSGNGDNDATNAPATATTTAVTTTTDAPTEAPTGPVYTVKVVDTDGNAISSVMVQICKVGDEGTCYPKATNEEGLAIYDTVDEYNYKASFIVVPSDYELVDPNETEFYFEDGEYEITLTLKAK